MRVLWLTVILSLVGCQRNETERKVVLPHVPPDTVVAAWSLISRSTDRGSVHVVLDATRTLTTTTRSANGTMMSVERTVSKAEYATLIGRLRELDCCSLESTDAERSDPAEAKPMLELELGDVQCEIELWDREWREGVARECGFAFARVHRAGFVPDPAVDGSPP
jgi:hypothetical protein